MPIGAGRSFVVRSQLVDDNRTRREVLGVVRNVGDVLVREGQPRAAVATGVRDRALLPELVPDRVGVGDPCGIGVVEVGRPVGDGRALVHAHSVISMANSGQLATALRAFVLELGRHFAVVQLVRVAVVVDVEQLRCDRVAAVVPLAFLRIDVHPHADLPDVVPPTVCPPAHRVLPGAVRSPSSRAGA